MVLQSKNKEQIVELRLIATSQENFRHFSILKATGNII